jgi:hypothetical protein
MEFLLLEVQGRVVEGKEGRAERATSPGVRHERPISNELAAIYIEHD